MESEGDLVSWAYILLFSNPLEDCGGEGLRRCVRAQGPGGPSQAWGDGAELWGFCGVWPVGLLTRQSNSVMFMMGYFCYCANLRHPQLDPLTLDRHPVLAGLPSPSFGPAVFIALFWSHTNIQCSLPISSSSLPPSLSPPSLGSIED